MFANTALMVQVVFYPSRFEVKTTLSTATTIDALGLELGGPEVIRNFESTLLVMAMNIITEIEIIPSAIQ